MVSRQENLQNFVNGLKVGSAKRFREGVVSARITWQEATGKKVKGKPVYVTRTKNVPMDVLYTKRFGFLPSRTVFSQTVSYDPGLTEDISSKFTTVWPGWSSKARLERQAARIHTPTLADLKQGREKEFKGVPDNARISVVFDRDATRKVTVVKLDPDAKAPGDEHHDTNVRLVIDTVGPTRARSERRVKVFVLHKAQSTEYLDHGTRTEEHVVRTTTERLPAFHKGAVRARRFAERMLEGLASHTLDVQRKPRTRMQEASKDTAPLTVSMKNTK